jgi:hypothetical protein
VNWKEKGERGIRRYEDMKIRRYEGKREEQKRIG